jgi:hypothetical protein
MPNIWGSKWLINSDGFRSEVQEELARVVIVSRLLSKHYTDGSFSNVSPLWNIYTKRQRDHDFFRNVVSAPGGHHDSTITYVFYVPVSHSTI